VGTAAAAAAEKGEEKRQKQVLQAVLRPTLSTLFVGCIALS
jgi:hypothetical protein